MLKIPNRLSPSTITSSHLTFNLGKDMHSDPIKGLFMVVLGESLQRKEEAC